MQQPDPTAIELYHDKINSSADAWRSFKNTSMWADIEGWTKERLAIVKDEALEAEDIEQLRGLQGAADILQQILLLPDAFINYLDIE